MDKNTATSPLPLKLMLKLNKVRGEITSAVKDKENKFSKFSYASFTSLWETVKTALINNNVYFDVFNDEEKDTVDTEKRKDAAGNEYESKTIWKAFTYKLIDLESGEVIERTQHYQRCTTLQGIQADGGTQTYALKYILNLAFMIPLAEDPDAVEANNKPKQQYRQAQPQQQQPTPGDLLKSAIERFYQYLDAGNIEGAKKGLQYLKDKFPTCNRDKMIADLEKRENELSKKAPEVAISTQQNAEESTSAAEK